MGIIVLKVITFFIFLICLGFVAYWAIAYIKGDCRLKVLKAKMSPLKVEKMEMDSVTLSYTLPIVNVGKQIGTIMDAFVRTYLPYEQYDKAAVAATLTAADDPRDDNYWQAFIMEIRKPKVFLIKIKLDGKSGNILRDLEDFPDMAMDVIYQVVARSDYYYDKTRIILTSEDLQTALYQYTSGVKR